MGTVQPLTDGLTLALGLLTGAMSAAFGVGGAVISTPGIRLLGTPALEAVGTTLPSILPSALVGTARYLREGLVDRRVVALAAPVGAVAAIVGSLSSHAVPGDGHWLMVVTSVLVGLTAVRLAKAGTGEGTVSGGAEGDGRKVAAPGGRVVVLGVIAGAMSGLLGVGGGSVLVPGFVTWLHLDIKRAIATSLACVGLVAVPATVTRALLGDINWRVALLLAVAVVPGARLGAAATIRARERSLRIAVAAVLGVIAVVFFAVELRAALAGGP